MLIEGSRAPILSVSLEHTVLDLTLVPQAEIGQEAVVLGRSGGAAIHLEQLARWQRTGVNDVLMTLNKRLPQHVLQSA